MPVYIFERMSVIGGGRGRLVEHIRRKWAPHAEAAHGVRLAGVWATVGSTAAWPEADALWEMDDWSHFAKAMETTHPLEEQDSYELELWRQALDWRSSGHSMLLTATTFSPSGAQLRALVGPVILYEEVETLPGKMDAYHAALQQHYLPVAKQRGMRLFGAYRHAIQPNFGVNLWSFESWDKCREALESEEGDSGVLTWRDRCKDLLVDQDGWLLAAPPASLLRT